jgi:hypothetical protein
MNCPECNNPDFDSNQVCSQCGLDLSESAWVIITTVSPPDDALMESLIESFGIPVRLIRSVGSVFGLSVGPLGEVKIAVPEAYASRAHELLQAELAESGPNE